MKLNSKIRFSISFLLMTFVAITFTQCDQNKKSTAETEVKEEWKEDRDNMKKELQGTIDDIDKELNKIEEKSKVVGDKLEDSWQKTVDGLKDTRTNLEKKIDDLDNANESNWEKLKEDADTAMDKVKTDMKKWENDIKDALDGK